MKRSVYLLLLFSIVLGCNQRPRFIPNIYIKNANSRITYFDVHHIGEAWSYGKGKGVKVGILDHYFGLDAYGEMYSGMVSFQDKKETEASQVLAHHGFWMASTLKEIAPSADVFALTALTEDEDSKARGMIDAIDWAIENDLDILTYSSGRLSIPNRTKVDAAIKRAYDNGLITVFIHTPGTHNILPSEISPPIENYDNSPDFNIYGYDYSIITGKYIDEKGKVDVGRYKAFMSVSSKAPVLAGIIAIMKDANPGLEIEEIREILIQTSYTFENYDTRIEKAVNACEAAKMSYELRQNLQ